MPISVEAPDGFLLGLGISSKFQSWLQKQTVEETYLCLIERPTSRGMSADHDAVWLSCGVPVMLISIPRPPDDAEDAIPAAVA